MGRIEKTVFISYRRANPWFARAIFQDLTHHGYDVFLDYNGIASGDFERVIIENIRARAHFIVILTPSALERCSDPADWLRREIETAIDSRRNIIPLMLENFTFSAPAIDSQLQGSLAQLKQYNALNIPADYFDEAMNRLREKFLSITLDTVLHPASLSAGRAAKQEQAAASSAPAVTGDQLTAEQWFERGFNSTDPDEQLLFYTNAIRLDPTDAIAFYNRGLARQAKGDLDGALLDSSEAIRLNPTDADAFNSRGLTRQAKGDLDGALLDYDEAIRFNPDDANAFYNRAIVRKAKGDPDGALLDYDEAIRLNPDYASAFYNRGNARKAKGDLNGALLDYNEAIRLNPDLPSAFYNRGNTRKAKGDLNGALLDYSEAIRLKPDHTNAFYNRGDLRQQKGQLSGAISDFQKYLGLGGGLPNGNAAEVKKRIRDLTQKL